VSSFIYECLFKGFREILVDLAGSRGINGDLQGLDSARYTSTPRTLIYNYLIWGFVGVNVDLED